MADLRDMQLLAALSRHKHFARAADECGISQPAFSARIRNMEADYGVPLVKRGNRFLGFTREGDIVLKWALRLLADEEGLKQEISNVRQDLTARLTLGTIPTAIPFAALAPSALAKAHPGVRVEVRSASSTDIAKGLEDFTFDAGVTYLEGDLSGAHKSVPLYEERYVLLAPQSIATGAEEISWAEASKLPLCLLTKNMRNRQIVDQAFEKAGVAPDPVAETNALTAALVQVVAGHAATIAPEMLLEGLPLSGDTVKLKLVEPVESRAVGLVTAERLPVPPALDALEAAMRLIAKEVADKGQG